MRRPNEASLPSSYNSSRVSSLRGFLWMIAGRFGGGDGDVPSCTTLAADQRSLAAPQSRQGQARTLRVLRDTLPMMARSLFCRKISPIRPDAAQFAFQLVVDPLGPTVPKHVNIQGSVSRHHRLRPMPKKLFRPTWRRITSS